MKSIVYFNLCILTVGLTVAPQNVYSDESWESSSVQKRIKEDGFEKSWFSRAILQDEHIFSGADDKDSRGRDVETNPSSMHRNICLPRWCSAHFLQKEQTLKNSKPKDANTIPADNQFANPDNLLTLSYEKVSLEVETVRTDRVETLGARVANKNNLKDLTVRYMAIVNSGSLTSWSDAEFMTVAKFKKIPPACMGWCTKENINLCASEKNILPSTEEELRQVCNFNQGKETLKKGLASYTWVNWDKWSKFHEDVKTQYYKPSSNKPIGSK